MNKREYQLAGEKVVVSPPTLVARSQGYLWFPTIIRLPDGHIMAVMSALHDVLTTKEHRGHPAMNSLSIDDGGAWGELFSSLYYEIPVPLDNGDVILLPNILYPEPGGMSAPYGLVRKGTHDIQAFDEGVFVEGWPRPDISSDPSLGVAGFTFNGQCVRGKDGEYLTTLYGRFEGDENLTLILVGSRDGLRWRVRSTIVQSAQRTGEASGASESALCRLKDGRLMSVFRTCSSDGLPPYGQVWSRDEGRTWTEPIAMQGGMLSVQPSLLVLSGGAVALSGGRPDIFLWLNAEGDGKHWEGINLRKHHNATCQPGDQIPDDPFPLEWTQRRTSSYTELLALNKREFLCIYDSVPNGWRPIPEGSVETNSVWVVRVTLPA